MMLIAQGGAKMAQSGSRLLQPKFANTKYGKAMKTRTTQGNLSPGQEQNIINRVSDTATRQGNVATNRYVGQMYNQGMGNSVALNRGLREAQNDVRRTVTDTSKGIYRDEELAKSNAKMNYAQAMDQDKAGRRQAIAGMVGAGLETAGQYFGNKATQSQAQDQSYMDAMNKYGQAVAYETPSGKTRYGGGLDPMTGKSSLSLDDKKNIEVYTQKANIKDVSGVTNAFQALQNGEIDGTEFRKQLSTGENSLTDDQIDDLFAFLAKIGGE